MLTKRPSRPRAVWFLLLFVLCGVTVTAAHAQTAAPPPSTLGPLPSLTPKTAHWRAVSEAGYIFCGKVISVREEPPSTNARFRYRRVFVEATVDETLKGAWAGDPTPLSPPTRHVHYYMPDLPQYRAYAASLVRAKRVVFFGSGRLHAPLVASGALVAALKDEIANQTRINAQFVTLPAARPDSFHDRVTILVAKTLSERTELGAWPDERTLTNTACQRAVDDLIALGPDAAPSVIRLMDDRREVSGGLVAFQIKPNGPNDKTFRTPYLVTDLLALVLPEITDPPPLPFHLLQYVQQWRLRQKRRGYAPRRHRQMARLAVLHASGGSESEQETGERRRAVTMSLWHREITKCRQYTP